MAAWYSIDNWVDLSTAVLTPSAEVATLTAANVARRQVGRRWRVASLASGSTSFYLDIDLGSARAIGVACLVTPRDNEPFSDLNAPLLASTDTVRWQFSTSAAGSTDQGDSTAVASGILPGYGYHVWIPSATITARYIRVTINATSRDTVPNNYVDIGRVWLGPLTEFLINYSAPMNYAWNSNSVATRSLKSVAEYVDRRAPYRSINAIFRGVKSAERDAMVDFERKTTNAAQILFGLTKTSASLPRDTMLCRNEARGLEQTNAAFFRRELALIESL